MIANTPPLTLTHPCSAPLGLPSLRSLVGHTVKITDLDHNEKNLAHQMNQLKHAMKEEQSHGHHKSSPRHGHNSHSHNSHKGNFEHIQQMDNAGKERFNDIQRTIDNIRGPLLEKMRENRLEIESLWSEFRRQNEVNRIHFDKVDDFLNSQPPSARWGRKHTVSDGDAIHGWATDHQDSDLDHGVKTHLHGAHTPPRSQSPNPSHNFHRSQSMMVKTSPSPSNRSLKRYSSVSSRDVHSPNSGGGGKTVTNTKSKLDALKRFTAKAKTTKWNLTINTATREVDEDLADESGHIDSDHKEEDDEKKAKWDTSLQSAAGGSPKSTPKTTTETTDTALNPRSTISPRSALLSPDMGGEFNFFSS